HLAASLSRSGILKYLTPDDILLYATDFCFDHRTIGINNNKQFAQRMRENGFLKVQALDENAMETLSRIYNEHKPKFMEKTLSALVLALNVNHPIVTEDDLLRSTAGAMGIATISKEDFLDRIVALIYIKGIDLEIDTDLIRMII